MRTPEEIYNSVLDDRHLSCDNRQGIVHILDHYKGWEIEAIRIAQEEAWNEAIDKAAKIAYKTMYDIGEYEEHVEKQVLKLKIRP